MKKTVRCWVLFIFMLCCTWCLIPAPKAEAGTKPVVILDSNNPPYAYCDSYVDYSVDVVNKTEDANIKYEWWGTFNFLQGSEHWGDDGWFKIDGDFTWAWNFDQQAIKVYVGMNDDQVDSEDYVVLKCKVTMDGEKAWSPVITVQPVPHNYVSAVTLAAKSGTVAKPVIGGKPNYEFVSKETSKYNVDNDGVYWYHYNTPERKWDLMSSNETFYEGGKYKVKVFFQPVSPNRIKVDDEYTDATIDGENAFIHSTDSDSQYYLSKTYTFKDGDWRNVTTLDQDVNVYNSTSGGSVVTTLSSGTTIQIMSISGSWATISYGNGTIGYIKSKIISNTVDNDYYVVISSIANLRKEPNGDSKVVSTVAYKQKYYVRKNVNGWLQVAKTKSSDPIGWVYRESLVMCPEDTAEQIKPVFVTVKGTRFNTIQVRSTPEKLSDNSNRIGGLKLNDVIAASGKTTDNNGNEWYIFQYKDQLGYAMAEFFGTPKSTRESYVSDNVVLVVDSGHTLLRSSLGTPAISCYDMKLGNEYTIKDIDTSSFSKGKLTLKIALKESISLPTDIADLKVRLGNDSVYKVVKKVKNANDSLTVVLQDKTKLSKPTLKTVKNKSSRKLALSWTKVSGADGYQIRLVRGTAKKVYKIKSGSKTSKTITKLKKKKYKVYVRAYSEVNGETYYSAWSKAKAVRIRK